jgi:hypothetical protein
MLGFEACKGFEWAARDDSPEIKHHCAYCHPFLPEVQPYYDGRVFQPTYWVTYRASGPARKQVHPVGRRW